MSQEEWEETLHEERETKTEEENKKMATVPRVLVEARMSQEECEEMLHNERKTKKDEENLVPVAADQQNKEVDWEKEKKQ